MVHPVRCRYYRALSLMETRFPVGSDSEHVRLAFTWYDSFRPSKKTEQASIYYEKACVLFNMGAVLTQLALAADRGSDAGLKDAARRFQVLVILRRWPSTVLLKTHGRPVGTLSLASGVGGSSSGGL